MKGKEINFEDKLWQAADKLRNNMDAAEYKHVVLGLIFLKYISDAFKEVYEELKNDPETADIPVVFLTGKDRADDQGRSFKAGGDMFIKKPFSCERLLEIVNIILMSSVKH